jgi:DNA-binding transcriptional LysR family regulator
MSHSENLNYFSLRELKVLVTVAEFGTISGAATKLGRSQAAVSTAISQIEARLGLQLFVRKPAKGLFTTSSGAVIVLEARGLLAHADEFAMIAGALGSGLEGEVSVGCFTNLAPVIFASLLAAFSREYPGIIVRMHIGDQEQVLQGLRSGMTELALTFDLDIPDSFEAIPMATLPPYAVVSVNHRLADREVISLSELIDEPFILMDLPHTREYFLSIFYSQHLEPRTRFRSTSFEAVRALVGNGLGYALLNLEPRFSRTYDGSEVVGLQLRETLRPLKIVLVSLRRVARRRIARTFQDFARSFLKTWREGQTGLKSSNKLI